MSQRIANRKELMHAVANLVKARQPTMVMYEAVVEALQKVASDDFDQPIGIAIFGQEKPDKSTLN